MITLTDVSSITCEITHTFSDITIEDAFGMSFDILWAERPQSKGELRKLVFQYAQRLANS